jgi:hypothetical protein
MTEPTRYAKQLAERREIAHIEQLANFGLALGWVFALVGGFCWFCVISRLDWLWATMLAVGMVLIVLAVLIPELLDVPCRWWMKLAHFQGWLVMTVMLTVVYFTLITPVGWFLRLRKGTHPFYSWEPGKAPALRTAWEPLSVRRVANANPTARRRSLLTLLLSTVGFFYGRGHYFVLPILIVLLVLGVILFFVQGSVLAPFIYTIF